MTSKNPAAKNNDENANTLAGKLLLAMPSIDDPRFDKSVIYICTHSEDEGTMGLVINQILPGIDMAELITQLNIKQDAPRKKDLISLDVLSGGPVDAARGFLLHSLDFSMKETMQITDDFGLTGTIETLEAIADGAGPEEYLFVLGYAGWDSGQLEEELQANAWLIIEPDNDLIFGTHPSEKWQKAIDDIGIDPAMLSAAAGHA